MDRDAGQYVRQLEPSGARGSHTLEILSSAALVKSIQSPGNPARSSAQPWPTAADSKAAGVPDVPVSWVRCKTAAFSFEDF